mmetsp:Transcript_29043/g.81251  ORF Transcript_29043/g.81251 Transcript_29043/m.81251 type:complete len:217 (+) Transcript_29043:179-829(+)|eukprot:CAMPEP_0119126286 /NCGR_PEP_ID=MMETSP1310-20130426/5271_1 /TAXON_ID=464262 /ORGANISM="Genus nov. species nov., Strain RCC2339" /LENGTH=216 /DNA_ID=CAMNT_0007116439 /DNA_START=131 /DNA_END=781 /DNA_ORIENTATION=+
MGSAPSYILGEEGEYEGKHRILQGGEDVLDDEAFFKEHGISHVMSICHRTIGSTARTEANIPEDNIYFIREMDTHSTNLSQYFVKTTKFIHEARKKGGNVYVHCSAGISRSSTITLAYMMTFYDRPLDELLPRLEHRRSCVNPNHGFMRQLLEWHSDPRRQALRAELRDSDKHVWEPYYKLDHATFLALPQAAPADPTPEFDLDDDDREDWVPGDP